MDMGTDDLDDLNLGGLESFRRGVFRVPLMLVKENSTFFKKKKVSEEQSMTQNNIHSQSFPNKKSFDQEASFQTAEVKKPKLAEDRGANLSSGTRSTGRSAGKGYKVTSSLQDIDFYDHKLSGSQTAREKDSLRPRTSVSIEALVSARKTAPTTEINKDNFEEEKVDFVLRMKGLSKVEDNGMQFLVGEYEQVERGKESQETASTRDKNPQDPEVSGQEANLGSNNEEPIAIEVDNINEIKSFGEGGICSICFTFEPDAVYMNCGHGGSRYLFRPLLSMFTRRMGT